MRRLIVGSVAALALLAATSLGSVAQADPGIGNGNGNGTKGIVGIDIGPYLWTTVGYTGQSYPSLGQVMIEDQPLLDAFAQEYARTTQRPDVEEFMMWWLNNRLHDIAQGKAQPPPGFKDEIDMSTPDGLKRALWLEHVIGNNTGAWYHWALDKFGPCRCTSTAPSTFYDARVPIYNAAANAATNPNISSTDLFNYVLSTLRSPTASPFGGQVGFYGYDTSFTLAQTVPPGAPNPPVVANPFAPEPFVSWFDGTNATNCQSTDCLLDAQYATGDPPFLSSARHDFTKMLNEKAPVQALLEQAIVGNGTPSANLYNQMNAGLGLGLQGVPSGSFAAWDDQYLWDTLLYAQLYTGMYNHAISMTGLAAYATQDTDLARTEAREQQLWNGYFNGYAGTVGDPLLSYTGQPLSDVQAKFVYSN